jgi:hypothetical protein
MIAFDEIDDSGEEGKTKKTAMIIVATIKTIGELATELIRKGQDEKTVYKLAYNLTLDRTGDSKKAEAFASLIMHEISMNLFCKPLLNKEDTDKIFDILFFED